VRGTAARGSSLRTPRCTGRGAGSYIHGRSDATLNPGGVPIGTAALHSQAEQGDGLLEALAAEQQLGAGAGRTSRLTVFVRLTGGGQNPDALANPEVLVHFRDRPERRR